MLISTSFPFSKSNFCFRTANLGTTELPMLTGKVTTLPTWPRHQQLSRIPGFPGLIPDHSSNKITRKIL